MRFDPDSLAREATSRLAVLMLAELVGMESDRERRGELAWVRDVVRPFQDLLQGVVERRGGAVQAETPTEYELSFETADAAVTAALALHQAVRAHDWQGPAPGLRIGVHVGQVVRFGGVDESRSAPGQPGDGRVPAGHPPGRGGTDAAHPRGVRHRAGTSAQAPSSGEGAAGELRWRSHGRYLMAGSEESLEVFEVGEEGHSPLAAPRDSAMARRADSAEQQKMHGWRPGLGQEIPRRPGWVIERKLGEGGFGEVWVARHERTRQHRVFKFCFDASRLGSFKRELTLFRLLRDALGDRADIARLLEVELDEAPVLPRERVCRRGQPRRMGRAGRPPGRADLEQRVRLVTEIAAAVAAAHSVGIIHKDIKPSNVFMRQGADGSWHPILADFGIGAVADRSQLEQRGITVAGFTQSILDPGSSRTGTRMYQPPEASLGRTATVQGDVYALGVLLYQVLVGNLGADAGDRLGAPPRRGADPAAGR